MKFRTINPAETTKRDLHQFMIGCVAPRPIAFVSSINAGGQTNLAPYSYFNAFSSNPPIVAFSSSIRPGPCPYKDTLRNARESGEVVINMVNHSIARQMVLTSIEFEYGVDEFKKSGLTPIASDLVSPFRVLESPVSMECRVRDIVSLGNDPGAGQIVLCEVLLIHISEESINEKNRIDPDKMDLVGRLGRAYYVRASGGSVLTLLQSGSHNSIGYDLLPEPIQTSPVLSGADLALLAEIDRLPNHAELSKWKIELSGKISLTSIKTRAEWHLLAKEILENDQGRRFEAMMTAMIPDILNGF